MRHSRKPRARTVAQRETGRKYRQAILEAGGSRPAMESFKAFRGREPSSTRCCGTRAWPESQSPRVPEDGAMQDQRPIRHAASRPPRPRSPSPASGRHGPAGLPHRRAGRQGHLLRPAAADRQGQGPPAVAAGGGTSRASLPFELRRPPTAIPWCSTPAPDCGPCGGPRVPPVARRPVHREDRQHQRRPEALQRLSGGVRVPLLTIGGQQLRGYSEPSGRSS
jgi:hypothetical protein